MPSYTDEEKDAAMEWIRRCMNKVRMTHMLGRQRNAELFAMGVLEGAFISGLIDREEQVELLEQMQAIGPGGL